MIPRSSLRRLVAALFLLAALVATAADLTPLFQQGKDLEAQKKYTEAVAAYTQALDLEPNNTTALSLRAVARNRTGDRTGALADLDRCLALDPAYDGARYQRSLVHAALKDFTAAIADLDELILRDPENARYHYDRARACRFAGRPAEAMQSAEEMLRLAPDNVNSWALRSMLREKSGDPVGALADTEKALALAKDEKSVALYTADRARLQPLAAAAATQPAAPKPTATAQTTVAKPASVAPSASAAAPAFTSLDLRELSAVQYNGAVSVAMEGLRAVYAPMSAADTAKFEKRWAPLFHKPSAKAVTYLNSLIPLVQEFLALRSLLGESAATYDRALEESRFAAGYGNDAGVAAAMSEAGRCKAVIEDGRSRLQALVTQIGALGDPPDAEAAHRRSKAQHAEALKTVKRVAGLPEELVYLKVDFSRQPEGWAHELNSVGSLEWHPYVPFGLYPMEDRHAYLISNEHQLKEGEKADLRRHYRERFGWAEFVYLGADLLDVGSITIEINLARAPFERPEDLELEAPTDGVRQFERVRFAHSPGLAMTTETDDPANLSWSLRQTIALDVGRGTDDCWAIVQIEAGCHNPVPSADSVREAAAWRERCKILRERILGRIRSLLDSLDFTFVSSVPATERARLAALREHTVAHPLRQISDEDEARFTAWRHGRWVLRPGADPLPHEATTAVRSGDLTQIGASSRLRSGDGRTEFLATWTPLPNTLTGGTSFDLEVKIEAVARQETRPGRFEPWKAKVGANLDELADQTSQTGLFEASAFASPEDGAAQGSASRRFLLAPLTYRGADKSREVLIHVYSSLYGDSRHYADYSFVYDWHWDLRGDDPRIPSSILPADGKQPPAAPPPPADRTREEAERKARQERIAEIRQNIGYIEKALAANRAEQARETDPQRRADYQFRIIGLESDILAEQDLIKSLETGTIVHTRSPFEQYAAATFEQQCQAEARAASLTFRAVESANRLAALLPPDEAAQARAFLARQFTPKMLAEHDVAKVREIVGAVSNKVQGHWQGEAAKGDLAAANAQFGMDAATNIKTAADYSMTACTLFGGGSINLLYQAGTGYAEGGFKQAAKNALTTWSDAADYAFTAYDAYQESGGKGAASALALKYAQGKATQYFAGKLMADAGHSAGGDTAAPAKRKPTLQEQFDAAKFKQERQWGEALVKDFQKTQNDLLKAGGSGAAPEAILKLQAAARDKAAAVASSLHAKNYLKYVADAGTGRAYDAHMNTVHAESDALLKQRMAAAGWNAGEWELVEFRNAASLGKPNMDRDVGLRERGLWQLSENGLPMKGVRNPDAWTTGPNGRPMPKPQLTKDGKPMSLDQWREEAQKFYNQAYRKASGGRSAEVAMEGITTSSHPEAYKDVLWLGDDKTLVSTAWAAQAGDVTRYKANHLLAKGDPSVSYFTKLQEVARGTAKDMDTKLLPLLAAAKPSAGGGLRARASVSADALALARGHWAEVQKTLQAFGRNDLDPLTATRRIRELTGGKSIPEVVDEMATLLESLGKAGR